MPGLLIGPGSHHRLPHLKKWRNPLIRAGPDYVKAVAAIGRLIAVRRISESRAQPIRG
jgi:hypothetical protein